MCEISQNTFDEKSTSIQVQVLSWCRQDSEPNLIYVANDHMASLGHKQ